MKKGIRVYNLYPKLVGQMEKWIEHFDRINAMNFNWIYINPINLPGFSGSDYAIKDYYQYHPLYVTGKYEFDDVAAQSQEGHELLKKVCKEARTREMKMMMDIVINHTAFDSALTKKHPDWYMQNPDGSIKHPGALAGTLDGADRVKWGDLAQIDNVNSPDRQNLWNYWLKFLLFYAELGIRGFRCDAAYHLPGDLWQFLIPKVKQKYPDTIFLGETLGCKPKELIAVGNNGFDYVMNSFMWWDYHEEWFLKDYRKWAGKYPSLTFPENHDTERCAVQVNGNKDLAILKYAVGAYVCSSIATTIGFEYGFRKKIDVVKTNPMWWEPAHYDISADLAEINRTKSSYAVLQEDNIIFPYQFSDEKLFGFTKDSLSGKEKILLIANPDGDNWHAAYVHGMYSLMGSHLVFDISPGHKMDHVPDNLEYHLPPGEVKLFYVKR